MMKKPISWKKNRHISGLFWKLNEVNEERPLPLSPKYIAWPSGCLNSQPLSLSHWRRAWRGEWDSEEWVTSSRECVWGEKKVGQGQNRRETFEGRGSPKRLRMMREVQTGSLSRVVAPKPRVRKQGRKERSALSNVRSQPSVFPQKGGQPGSSGA